MLWSLGGFSFPNPWRCDVMLSAWWCVFLSRIRHYFMGGFVNFLGARALSIHPQQLNTENVRKSTEYTVQGVL